MLHTENANLYPPPCTKKENRKTYFFDGKNLIAQEKGELAFFMQKDLWAKEAAARLKDKHPKHLKNWPTRDLEIWLRDDCKCVYCGRDMLESRAITYFFYCYDHVLPVSKYESLKRELWNQVLACNACNEWKKTFDPSSVGIPASEEHREQLIETARTYIQQQREQPEALFREEKRIIIEVLPERDDARAATA